jgi:hypothetical protein
MAFKVSEDSGAVNLEAHDELGHRGPALVAGHEVLDFLRTEPALGLPGRGLSDHADGDAIALLGRHGLPQLPDLR